MTERAMQKQADGSWAPVVTWRDFTFTDAGWELPIGEDSFLRVVKEGEDCEAGYFYSMFIVEHGFSRPVAAGWFQGFGCEDRPNDAIHTVRRILAD